MTDIKTLQDTVTALEARVDQLEKEIKKTVGIALLGALFLSIIF